MTLPRMVEVASAIAIAGFSCLTAVFVLSAQDRANTLDVYSPEKLRYEMTWWVFGAGEITLSLNVAVGPADSRAFQMTYLVKSSGLAGRFFKVDDRIDSYVDPLTRCSVAVEKRLREGKTVQDSRVEFDYGAGKALITNFAAGTAGSGRVPVDRSERPIGDCVQDILSALYAIRSHDPLPAGSSFKVWTFDRGDLYEMAVSVLKRETVTIGLGRFSAFVVEPQPRFGGSFGKSGKLRIWIEDGPARLPLIIKTDLAVGSLKAELREMTRAPRSR
ncbi:MAG: DUF3108 domain-containing protein [Acidobacteriota bacterium]